MGLFKQKALPTTSYGYSPPPNATARGWVCTNYDCARGEPEPVRRWPRPCPDCGSPTDPQFNQPWAHDAEGVELQWILREHPERGGGFYEDQWQVWQFKDALLRGDRARVAELRNAARARAVSRHEQDVWWIPGDVFFHYVWNALDAGDLDGAADDLIFWMSLSSSDDVENNNTNRTNCRQVVDMTTRFLAAGGAAHPRSPEVKQGCLRLAEGAFPVLLNEQQVAIRQMARS